MIEDLWYKDGLIYAADVASFKDGNGDGVGDFAGLERELDYLAGLGVTCLWLRPFYPSPRRDDGYDVADYYGVDPRYGSLGEFVAFAHKARQNGLRVMVDLVLNHTSDQHPWFQSARSSPDSPYRHFYYWSEKRPPNADEGMVFPGVQESVWTRDERAGAWYFHRFYSFEPDLNTMNPKVRTELQHVMGFWLELGVSGFRLDATPFLLRRPDDPQKDFEYLQEIREFLQWRSGSCALLAEANVPPEEVAGYFGERGGRVQMIFNFGVNQALFHALATGEAKLLARALEATGRPPHQAQWVQFLRNHDELDLGRLSSAQRRRVYEAFAPDEDMRVYERGIRRRVAPMLGNDRRRLELAYSLLLTLPGTPMLYYGDEIGMGEDLAQPERLSVRTPMQWSEARNAGFTRAEPLRPVIRDGAFGYRAVNVADQQRDGGSLLNWIAGAIRARREVPEIGWGRFTLPATGSPNALAVRYEWRDEVVVALHNLAAERREVTLEMDTPPGAVLVNLLSRDHCGRNEDGRYRVSLEGYGYRWYRLATEGDAVP